MVWRSARACNLHNSSSNTTQLISDYTLTSESSEGEFVEEEKPWPPVRSSRPRSRRQEPHPPRPHSHLFRTKDGRMRGGKHSRRWENSMYLNSLHGIPEEEFEMNSTILPSHDSPFTKLHTSDKCMQIWCSFSSRSEEEQEEILAGRLGELERGNECTGNVPSGEECIRRIDHRIRSVLQHNKCVPLDLLSELEDDLTNCFSLDPRAVVVVLQTNPFCRLLLHGVCQYLDLESSTEVFGGCSMVMVECKRDHFTVPLSTLSQHFQKNRR